MDTSDPSDEKISDDIAEKVNKHFAFFQGKCRRGHRIILSETDYDKLIEWTISFYKSDFEVPEILEPIQKIYTNKTYVQLAFKHLFKVLHPSEYYPDSLFTFYTKAFNEYRDDKMKNFRSVSSNEALEKLMKLESI